MDHFEVSTRHTKVNLLSRYETFDNLSTPNHKIIEFIASTAVLAKRMKVWERRLMRDFHVAPVEMAECDAEEQKEVHDKVDESPLERFRRISKQVASQSVNVKWNEVIRGATIEANSQIGRSKNRESYKNQQNLLRAMEQARELIERSPMLPSPNHSYNYDVMDQTNQTLVQLLKDISEEINELPPPSNTLQVGAPTNRSVTPLESLNVQLQSLISKSPSPRPIKAKTSPRPAANMRTTLLEETSSSQLKHLPSSPSPSRAETPKSPIPKTSIAKMRSPTPDSGRSHDSISSFRSIPVIEVTAELASKPDSPKLIDFRHEEQCPLKQGPGSPIKVFKRKAPTPTPNSVSRPASLKIAKDQGMIPPPPCKDDIRPLQIPILSTTPATPLFKPKSMSTVSGDCSSELIPGVSSDLSTPNTEAPELPKSPPPSKPSTVPMNSHSEEPAVPAMIAATSPVSHSVTEKLMSSESNLKGRSPSPACLRPGNKIEDVKTLKRHTRAWL